MRRPPQLILAFYILASLTVAISSAPAIDQPPRRPPAIDQRPPAIDPFAAEVQARKAKTHIAFAPWAAGLTQTSDPSLRGYFCGATIIAARWVLTTAHCAHYKLTDAILLYGAASLELSIRAKIEHAVVHPDFDGALFRNDIALLKTSTDLRIPNALFGLPKVPSSLDLFGAADAKLFGWGTLSEGGSLDGNLVQLDASLVEEGICNSPVAYAGRVAHEMLCAQSKVPGIDACQGFGGSGLIVYQSSGPELVGLVSWGEGCGRPNKPGVYTKVPSFRDWINKHIDEGR